MTAYETVIGLEVHVELATKSKIFCSCTNGSDAEPNTHVCPACCGMPGMLPVANRQVINLGMTAGMTGKPLIGYIRNYWYRTALAHMNSEGFSPTGIS